MDMVSNNRAKVALWGSKAKTLPEARLLDKHFHAARKFGKIFAAESKMSISIGDLNLSDHPLSKLKQPFGELPQVVPLRPWPASSIAANSLVCKQGPEMSEHKRVLRFSTATEGGWEL
jgi:hypothetical protein